MSDVLMMIGAGVMQYPAIEAAKDAGYRVVAVDGSVDACGREIADFFLHADISLPDEVISQALAFHENTAPVGGVITIGTDFSYTVARVAEALQLVGVSPETALAATHKDIMRTRFKEQNVPCPGFFVVQSLEEARKAFKDIGGRSVIKPVDNMGARGVRLIGDEGDLDDFFAQTYRESRTGKVIIEEYMKGPELSIDSLVYNGEIHLLTIADRIISGEPYFIERGHTIPSTLDDETLKRVFDVMKQGIRALGIKVGASKADMKVTPEGPKIGEMTARLSGGFHSQYTDPLATGMRSMKAAIDIAMGKPLDKSDITPKFQKSACERSLYPEPGRVVKVSGVEEALQMKGIEKIFISVSSGDILKPVTSNMGKAGHIVARGDTRLEAIGNCEAAMKAIRIETEEI